MSAEHVERLRRAFELADASNPGAIFELLAPDVEFVVSGKDPTAGEWRGHAGVVEFFTSWAESWETWEANPERFVEIGDDQVAVGFHQRARGRVSGIEVENHPAHLWTFKDGRAVRWQIFPSIEEALSAAEPAS